MTDDKLNPMSPQFDRDDFFASKKKIDCISKVTVLEVTWTNCPDAVVEDVRKLWQDMGFRNDNYYAWSAKIDLQDAIAEERPYAYPMLAAYLKGRGITECLIHYWW